MRTIFMAAAMGLLLTSPSVYAGPDAPRYQPPRRPVVLPILYAGFAFLEGFDAPALHCQTCHHPLTHKQTVIGGFKHPERWDYYQCRMCGQDVRYRHRTRRLIAVTETP
jgi:hypothetical protein